MYHVIIIFTSHSSTTTQITNILCCLLDISLLLSLHYMVKFISLHVAEVVGPVAQGN